MRRNCYTAVLCILLTVLFGCSKQPASNGAAETTTPLQPNASASVQSGSSTLMVYMVGSDLEAKGGAGTNDLEEMATSGVSLENTNVVVYAGGSKRWHNDTVTAEDAHSILYLGAEGFQVVSTVPEMSMGEADCLAGFVNYVCENYPADSYSLILWDHGDGPLIGYGKDMLFDNDSLTLAEMRGAMDQTPFGKDKKLEWVGFDACLMSSAELACLWSDYANYLVASQEIEPAFGWNYAFLSQIGKAPTQQLLGDMTQEYLNTCEAYYERKGYDDRDTTLACMDLSQIEPLKTAIANLFQKALADVGSNYNGLTASRVNTRALGRASTGSEYDLIDLYDMATQLQDIYPDEAKALQTAVDSLVIANATNAQQCCGLSIYYPFYNKSYYEKTWGQVYAELGVMPEYAAYLTAYADVWLGSDMLDSTDKTVAAEAKTESQFVLTLTDEQAEAYADAKYYIMRQAGDQLYCQTYSSGNVTKDGNTLIANFDGQVLYGKTKFDEYWVLNADEHDTVGDITRYSVYANLTNQRPVWGDEPEGYEQTVMGYRFHLSANNKTKTVNKSALVRYDVQVDSESLAGGKLEEADLSQWSQYNFLNERHRYMARYENGLLKPVSQWPESGYLSGYAVPVEDLDAFLFAPIPDGKYYVLFEIEDVQGNRYCSEPLEIVKTGNDLSQQYSADPVEVTWNDGDKVKLFEKEGVTLYLTTMDDYGKTRYTIEAVNSNDYDVAVLGMSLGYNDEVDCADGSTVWFNVPAGESATYSYGFNFGDAQELELIEKLKSLQMRFKIKTASGNRTMIYEQPVSVTLSESVSVIPQPDSWTENYYQFDAATRGMLAGKQVLFTENDLTCTLLGMGGDGSENGKIVVAMELYNAGTQAVNLRFNGFIFDGIFVEEESGPITVYPGTKQYVALMLLEDELDEFMITSPSNAGVQVCFMEFATLQGGGGFSQMHRYPITLSRKGSGCKFTLGDRKVYNENGISIAVRSVQEPDEYYSSYVWTMTVVNNSAEDIIIDLTHVKLCGLDVDMDTIGSPVTYRYGRCGAGEKTIFRISSDYSEELGEMELSFIPVFYDALAEKEVYRGTEPIILTP